MVTLAIVLCIYLLFFRPLINQRYPLFYSYLVLSFGFELFLFVCEFNAVMGPSPRAIAYQLIYLFQLYLLAYLWREVLQRDYPSLRFLVYLFMIFASLATLFWSAQTLSIRGFTSAMQNSLVLNGLAAPSFFAALLLVITFWKFRIPVPRPLRGILYGLLLLTGMDFLAIFAGDGGFIVGYNRVYPWLGSLIIYCRFFTSVSPDVLELGPAQPSMLTINQELLKLDQAIFYGLMVKTRLYNPLTEAYYYRFCPAILPDTTRRGLRAHAYFRRLYAKHRYHWVGAYYRVVDRIILGRRCDMDFHDRERPASVPSPSVAPELNFPAGALASQGPERRSPQV